MENRILKMFNRRAVLKGIGMASLFAFAPIRSSLLSALLEDRAQGGDGVSEFKEVSGVLLGISISELDTHVAQTYWKQLATQPTNRKRLETLHKVIKKNPGISVGSQTQLPAEVRPFAKQLIQAWYTGVIEVHPGTLKRFFYDESLMFSSFSKDRPAPGNCYGAFGDWVKNPYA